MKITPIEIRQKSFEKKLRGYDKDEVSAFLLSLSNEWERVLDENKENRIKLDQAEKEVQKLREVENSLFKTLKTAEDTGANLIDQANKAADLHLKETEMKAEALMSESKSKARGIIERAELQAKEMIEEMQEALKDLEKNYRSLENQRDNLLAELKILSSDIMDRLDRTSSRQTGQFKVEDHMKRVRDMVRDSEQRINDQKLEQTATGKSEIPPINPKDQGSVNKLQAFIEEKEEATSKKNTKLSEKEEQPVVHAPKPKPEPTESNKNGMADETQKKITKLIAKQKRVETKRKDSGEQDPSEGGSFFDSL